MMRTWCPSLASSFHAHLHDSQASPRRRQLARGRSSLAAARARKPGLSAWPRDSSVQAFPRRRQPWPAPARASPPEPPLLLASPVAGCSRLRSQAQPPDMAARELRAAMLRPRRACRACALLLRATSPHRVLPAHGSRCLGLAWHCRRRLVEYRELTGMLTVAGG